MSLGVECYAGYRGEEEPIAVSMGGRRMVISDILERWVTPDHRGFRIKADNGRLYILCHDIASGGWDMREIPGS